jgi:hypothetical protein
MSLVRRAPASGPCLLPSLFQVVNPTLLRVGVAVQRNAQQRRTPKLVDVVLLNDPKVHFGRWPLISAKIKIDGLGRPDIDALRTSALVFTSSPNSMNNVVLTSKYQALF